MKRLLLLMLLGSMMLNIWGCGKTESNEADNQVESDADMNVADNEGNENEDSSVPLPEPETGELTADEELIFSRCVFKQLGVMEFAEQEGESFTDKASDGMTYLVLFLKYQNNLTEARYLNVGGFKATVDGKEVETTFLLNDPKSYPVFSQTVQPDKAGYGYVVWEVPENWEKLEYTFDGLAFTDNITFTGVLTSDDLSEPDEFDEDLLID